MAKRIAAQEGGRCAFYNIKGGVPVYRAGAAAAALAVPGSGGGGSGGGLRGSGSEDPSEPSTTEARLKDGFAASLQTEARCSTQRAMNRACFMANWLSQSQSSSWPSLPLRQSSRQLWRASWQTRIKYTKEGK